MKFLILFISFSLFSVFWNGADTKDNCFPDKGIKTAFHSIEKQSPNSETDNHEVNYNKAGQAVLVKANLSTFEKTFESGKLQLMITTRKILPSFYVQNEYESVVANAESLTDTTFVLSHYEDGREQKMIAADSSIWLMEYIGCDEAFTTILNTNGDTLQQFYNKSKDGLLIESSWTSIIPYEYHLSTKYFDYEFDKKGQWIKRSYSKNEDFFTESRALIYY